MANQFESFIEGQKKMMEWWTDSTRKMMDSLSETGQQQPKAGFLKDWYEKQKSLFEAAAKIQDPKEAFEKAPEHFKKWVDLQQELSETWMKAYKDGAEKLGFKIPDMNGHAPHKFFEKSMESWAERMQENTDWLKKNVLDKLPFAMKPHYENFTAIYEEMYKFWEPFQRMIQFGLFEKKAVDTFFSPDRYQMIIDKLMGFKNTGSWSEWINSMQSLFDQYLDLARKAVPTAEDWSDSWKKMYEQMTGTKANPFFQAAIDLNQQMKEQVEPYLNLAGFGKEGQLAHILKDIQFSYTAFVVRSAEMQSKVYEAGQFALPNTLQHFYGAYSESREIPDFETFFNHFIDELEKDISKVLDSKEYSKMQSEVAKLGVTVKGKLDELVEKSMQNTPFMMKSQGDDLARENTTLRRKMRDLEKRLEELEGQVAGKKGSVKKETNSKKSAAKK